MAEADEGAPKTVNELYEQTLATLERTLHLLADRVPSPKRVPVGDSFVYRYEERSIHQAIVQKLARLISSLRAAELLLEAGYLQEQAALQRSLDECSEDVQFLSLGVIYADITDLHRRWLKAFYEEEFDTPADPIASVQTRDTPARKKIRAYIARSKASASIEPTRSGAVGETISKAYSGYVHGASPHIMEMYGGDPPRFHVHGLLGTPLYDTHRDDLWNYFYRGILTFGMAAKAFGDDKLFEQIRQTANEFEKTQPA